VFFSGISSNAITEVAARMIKAALASLFRWIPRSVDCRRRSFEFLDPSFPLSQHEIGSNRPRDHHERKRTEEGSEDQGNRHAMDRVSDLLPNQVSPATQGRND
jgi:hypothetical protein